MNYVNFCKKKKCNKCRHLIRKHGISNVYYILYKIKYFVYFIGFQIIFTYYKNYLFPTVFYCNYYVSSAVLRILQVILHWLINRCLTEVITSVRIITCLQIFTCIKTQFSTDFDINSIVHTCGGTQWQTRSHPHSRSDYVSLAHSFQCLLRRSVF